MSGIEVLCTLSYGRGIFRVMGVLGFSLTSCGALWALLAGIIPNSE